MSFLSDKQPCKTCGDLYDPDLLADDECRDCRSYDPREHQEIDDEDVSEADDNDFEAFYLRPLRFED